MEDKTEYLERRVEYLEDSYHVMSSLIGLLRLELTKPFPNTQKMTMYGDTYCSKLNLLEEEYGRYLKEC